MRSDNPANVSESGRLAPLPVSSESASGSGAAQQHDGPIRSGASSDALASHEPVDVAIHPDALKGLANIATSDGSRHAQSAVRIETKRHGNLAMATDGRIAAVVVLAGSTRMLPKTGAFHLPRAFALQAAREGEFKRTGEVHLELNGTAKFVSRKRLVLSCEEQPMDVTFPDVQAVMPEWRDDDIQVTLNADLLAKIQAAIAQGTHDDLTCVTLHIPRKFDAGKPLRVTARQGYGAIMPIEAPRIGTDGLPEKVARK